MHVPLTVGTFRCCITRTPRVTYVLLADAGSEGSAQTRKEDDMTEANLISPTRLKLPLRVEAVRAVDDAGGVHYETVMTGAYIRDLVDSGLLKLTGNIRPDHMEGQRMKLKTKNKIDAWARELLQNDAVIGNISIRLDPKSSLWELDEEDGQTDLVVDRGEFDCGIDSLSRIKAILKAAKSPAGTFDQGTRFQVRIWIAERELANRVAMVYNTRGDKVNDSAAKYAYSETAEQRLARALMMDSSHLGQDNIEVLSNTVSASSHKLAAFNTLSQALETFWTGEPINEAEEKEQAAYLVAFWDALVAVRPEFGRLTKSQRQSYRGTSIAGTALSVHGVIAVASAMFEQEADPAGGLKPLAETVFVGGNPVDYFSYENPVWTEIGALVPSKDRSGAIKKTLRMSFQTRSAVANELQRQLGL